MMTQTPQTPTDTRQSGTVKYFDPLKSFGYIARAGQADLFFLYSELLGEIPQTPKKGAAVTFDVVKGPRGPQAIHVCNLDDPESVAACEAWMTPARAKFRADEADSQARLVARFSHLRTPQQRQAERAAAATTPVKGEDITLDAGDLYFLARVALGNGMTSANRITPALKTQRLLTQVNDTAVFEMTTLGRDAVISNLWAELERTRNEITRLKTQLAQK